MVDCVTKSDVARQVRLQNIMNPITVRVLRNYSPQLGGVHKCRKIPSKTLQSSIHNLLHAHSSVSTYLDPWQKPCIHVRMKYWSIDCDPAEAVLLVNAQQHMLNRNFSVVRTKNVSDSFFKSVRNRQFLPCWVLCIKNVLRSE